MEQEEIEILLWDYIDGNLPSTEKRSVENLIESNARWKELYARLLRTHKEFNFMELDEPSLRFTKNVMEEIARSQIAGSAKTYLNKKVIWGIGLFFLATILGAIVLFIGQIDWSAGSTVKTNPAFELDKIDFTKPFNNGVTTVFLMANVVLGLFLLDRFLASKRKSWVGKV